MVSWILMSIAVVLVAAATFVYGAKVRELSERLTALSEVDAKAHETTADNIEALRTLLRTLDDTKLGKEEFAEWVTDGKSKVNPSLEQGFENMLSYDPFQKRE